MITQEQEGFTLVADQGLAMSGHHKHTFESLHMNVNNEFSSATVEKVSV